MKLFLVQTLHKSSRGNCTYVWRYPSGGFVP